MRLRSVVAVTLVATACGVKTHVVMLDPASPGYEPISPDSVRVFLTERDVLVEYEPVAYLYAEGEGSGTSAAHGPDIIRAFREKAAELGCDAVIVGEVKEQSLAEGTRIRIYGLEFEDAEAETRPATGNALAVRLIMPSPR